MANSTCHNYPINDANEDPENTYTNKRENNDLDSLLFLISVIRRWLSNDGITVGALVYVVMEAVQAAWDATAAASEKPWAVFNLFPQAQEWNLYETKCEF